MYATRPLPRPKDPLSTSKNALVTELQPGVTFIHRPPPTTPTPHSLTTAPSSPLLSSSSSPSPSSLVAPSTPSSSSHLPPVVGSGPPEKRYHLTPQQIGAMRHLRAEDPAHWTVSRLAKKFNCTPAFVQITAPASKARKVELEKELQEQKAGWGHRKTLLKAIKQKRREFW
ncbi:hypothetical protein DL93DRAFT_2071215 [Clavulina sp. PMI_390]|nr:hypothetical protein DL93DRAFT_2071215 [Clavulina sp. PMI_390]